MVKFFGVLCLALALVGTTNACPSGGGGFSQGYGAVGYGCGVQAIAPVAVYAPQAITYSVPVAAAVQVPVVTQAVVPFNYTVTQSAPFVSSYGSTLYNYGYGAGACNSAGVYGNGVGVYGNGVGVAHNNHVIRANNGHAVVAVNNGHAAVVAVNNNHAAVNAVSNNRAVIRQHNNAGGSRTVVRTR